MAGLGRIDEAIPFFKRAFTQDESWIELLRRLSTVGLLSADTETIDRIVRESRR